MHLQQHIQHNKPKAQKGSLRFARIKRGIFLTGLAVFAQLYIFQPMLPHLCKDFGIAPATSSWSVSMATAGMAFGLFFFSLKADSWSRKKLMTFALFSSSILTLISAFVPWFATLSAVSFVRGALLSGVSAVALTYLNEEVDEKIIGLAISLYLSGNAVGGMSGRIVSAFLSGLIGWRATLFVVGLITFSIAIVFYRIFPSSQHFTPSKFSIGTKFKQMRGYLRTPLMIQMYLCAFLLMGGFVSIYNYTGFHLEAPPYSLPHTIIASIFFMYILGILGSLYAGRLSDKHSTRVLIRYFVAGSIIGQLMMLSQQLWLLVLGLCVFTFNFFATHAMASRTVSQNAGEGRSSATSLYWLFYYLGSSILGTSTGSLLSTGGWCCFMLTLITISAGCFLWLMGTKYKGMGMKVYE
ncbi:MAG: MFS transporter [Salinivirgaceae bacterium]|nr:MFS transporter [Salinivirgaceae bacterium]